MLLGKYEKGSTKIPDSVAEKLKSLADAATAAEIEVKKTVRKEARKAIGIPNIIIQSPQGGNITMEEIAGKVPEKTADVYVRVDDNKLYYVLENGETGDVVIWGLLYKTGVYVTITHVWIGYQRVNSFLNTSRMREGKLWRELFRLGRRILRA